MSPRQVEDALCAAVAKGAEALHDACSAVTPPEAGARVLVPLPHPATRPEDISGFAALPTWAAYAVACAALDAYGTERGWVDRARRWGWSPPEAARATVARLPHVILSEAFRDMGIAWVRPT